MPPSSLADDYRQKAAECLRLAQERADPASKAMLLAMAQEWLELADRHAAEEGRDD
jgi:hypothetical protein